MRRVNLRVPRSEAVRGARARPPMTTVSRLFWHGHGTAVAIQAGASVQGGIRQGILCPAASLGNVSDLRFLISALLIVSGIFPQRCALIVPCIDHESIRRLSRR